MKKGFWKHRRVITVLALAAGLVATTAESRQVRLFAGRQAIAPIVTDREIELPTLTSAQQRALTAEARAQRELDALHARYVQDLAYHLEAMTGQRPEIIVASDAASLPSPAIVIGPLAHRLGAEPQHRTVMRESFRLLTRDGRVLIGGESDYGVSHGVYELLRRIGCDWIFPGPEGEIIPRVNTLNAGPFDVALKPAFEVRAPWYSGGGQIVSREDVQEFSQWCMRHQQSLPGQRQMHPTFLGGGHYWHGLIQKYRKYLQENPAYRALTRQPDGSLERTWAQLDAANPGLVELTVRDIRETFERNNWPKDHAVSLSIGPNDGGGYSISPESMAAGAGRVDPVTGDTDQTDVLVLYANHVLEALGEEFPNLYLGWYLYSNHADFPMRYTPHPRFTVNIADITYSRYHSLLDTRSPTRTFYRGILEQWARLHRDQGNPLSFYGYNWNLAENLMPYSKMKIWGQDLPYYHAMGVVGHNNEQDKAWSILGPHNYLMARMGWDIGLDWRKVLKEYCAMAFGKGAPEMEAYYLDLIETQESPGYEAGAYASIHLIFDRGFIARSRARFQRAANAADTEAHRRNVDYFGQPVTALERYLDYRDAVTAFDFARAKEAFDAMIAHWETYNGKNANLVSRYGRRYAANWLFGPYVNLGLKYTTGDYRMVTPLPDELSTILDPNAMGQFMGLYHPDVRDHGWMKTRTWSSTWEAQGLGPYRQGAVWYRIRLELPAVKDGEGIGLLLGAVEDEAHVWCNGQYIGRGRGYMRPMVFDLTEHARPGKDNLVAIQIIRHNMLNELWTGGLMTPSFVFAGPRLESPAPRTEPLYRILPGGSRESITQ